MVSLFSVVKELIAQSEEEQLALYAETVLYLSGATSAFDYQNVIRTACQKRSPKLFRLSMLNAKYTLVNIKLYVFSLLKETNLTPSALKRLAASFEIHEADSKRISALVMECSWFKREARRVLRGIPKGSKLLTLAGIDNLFTAVYAPIDRYAKFLAFNKLRFIAKSNNYEIEDLAKDIMEKVVQSFYLLVPTDQTEDYVKNYLKRCAHNKAINIIKANTTQKKGRLVEVANKDGIREFSLLCASINQTRLIADSTGNLAEDVEDTENSMQKFETTFSVGEVLTRHQRNERKYQSLLILMGELDLDFTSWLRSNNYCKQSEDNTELQARLGVEEFNRLIADYMEIRYEQLRRFIDSLRPELCDA